MKVLAVVQAWNKDDPKGGFIISWLEKMAEQVETVTVLALEQRQASTRSNIEIFSLSKEFYNGWGRQFFYLARWHYQARRILAEKEIDVIFVHMSPIYSVLIYPYIFFKKIPIITWLIHPQADWLVKLAHHLSTKVVSALAVTYPYKKNKLIVVGHGIDIQLFQDSGGLPDQPPLILCVGRLSPIKNHLTLIKAMAQLKNQGLKLRLAIIGRPTSNEDRVYEKMLKYQVEWLGLQEQVEFVAGVPLTDLPAWYGRCSLLVNLTPSGSLDKVVLEAMACKKPVLVTSESFKEIFGSLTEKLTFRFGDADDLSQKIINLLSLSIKEKEQLGAALQKIVQRSFNLELTIKKIVAVLRSCVSRMPSLAKTTSRAIRFFNFKKSLSQTWLSTLLLSIGLKKLNNRPTIVVCTINEDFVRLWLYFARRCLDLDRWQLVVVDGSGEMRPERLKGATVLKFFNLYHGQKIDWLLKTAVNSELVFLCDDDKYLLKDPASLLDNFLEKNLAAISLCYRKHYQIKIGSQTHWPMGSYALIFNKKIFRRHRLGFKPVRWLWSDKRVPLDSGRVNNSYDTADFANETLLMNNYQIFTYDEGEFVSGFSGLSAVYLLLRNRGKEYVKSALENIDNFQGSNASVLHALYCLVNFESLFVRIFKEKPAFQSGFSEDEVRAIIEQNLLVPAEQKNNSLSYFDRMDRIYEQLLT